MHFLFAACPIGGSRFQFVYFFNSNLLPKPRSRFPLVPSFCSKAPVSYFLFPNTRISTLLHNCFANLTARDSLCDNVWDGSSTARVQSRSVDTKTRFVSLNKGDERIRLSYDQNGTISVIQMQGIGDRQSAMEYCIGIENWTLLHELYISLRKQRPNSEDLEPGPTECIQPTGIQSEVWWSGENRTWNLFNLS